MYVNIHMVLSKIGTTHYMGGGRRERGEATPAREPLTFTGKKFVKMNWGGGRETSLTATAGVRHSPPHPHVYTSSSPGCTHTKGKSKEHTHTCGWLPTNARNHRTRGASRRISLERRLVGVRDGRPRGAGAAARRDRGPEAAPMKADSNPEPGSKRVRPSSSSADESLTQVRLRARASAWATVAIPGLALRTGWHCAGTGLGQWPELAALGKGKLRLFTTIINRGKPQLGRWAFYWEGVFGAAQNVGRFWCRHPARLLWASGRHPRGQSRLIWVRQGPWVP
eukprot:scaffold8582_cov130-Isochrysis_galbana.AAC.2